MDRHVGIQLDMSDLNRPVPMSKKFSKHQRFAVMQIFALLCCIFMHVKLEQEAKGVWQRLHRMTLRTRHAVYTARAAVHLNA